MKEIPLFGWILIIVIAGIVISSYWSLVSLLRNKDKKPQQPSWTKSWQALTKPWEAENKQLDELSRQVSNLHSNASSDDKSGSPPA